MESRLPVYILGRESTRRFGVVLLYPEDLSSENVALCGGRSVYFTENMQTQGRLF